METTSPVLMETFLEGALSEFQYALAAIKKAHDLNERATQLNTLGEFCYMNVEMMLRYAFVRRDLFKEFETFFGLLKGGATVPLDLRDQVNRLYGMLLEMRRGIEKDPLCQF